MRQARTGQVGRKVIVDSRHNRLAIARMNGGPWENTIVTAYGLRRQVRVIAVLALFHPNLIKLAGYEFGPTLMIGAAHLANPAAALRLG